MDPERAGDNRHLDWASRCGCCLSMGRRDFMTTVGLSALAANSAMSAMVSAASGTGSARKSKPLVRAVFLRPDVDRYWMGWPGASYDIHARQADYTKVLQKAAQREQVHLEVTDEPISNAAAMNRLLQQCKTSAPDGVILTVMSLNTGWKETNRFVVERPPEIPTVVFSPMGTSFTGHLQATRNKPKTLVAATQEIDWLAQGLHMLRTIWDMKTTRLCIVKGERTEDKVLDVIGTTLHYIPLTRWEDALAKIRAEEEIRRLAERFTKTAKEIREPNAQDIHNAAKNYFVAKQIMADEDCDGISINCLGLVGQRRINCPPCMAWMQLNDEGSVGTCECDWNAAISHRLCSLLTGRPGFQQDPAPNTINGTLMGAHCTSATRLHGFDKDPAPLILRSHSESSIGVSPQVIWPVGEPVTVMKFNGPQQIILGTGKVAANIDTPPAGGCRTSVELEIDQEKDPRDCKGFHQLFICGRVDKLFEQYCQLAGIEVVPI